MVSTSSRRAPALLIGSSAVPFAISAFLLLFSSLVGGVDILFCTANQCHGTCLGCRDLSREDCCISEVTPSALSVQINNANIDVPASTKMFTAASCNGTPNRGHEGDGCELQIWVPYKAAYYTTVRPSRFANPGGSKAAVFSGRDVEPNAAFFTETGKTGKWVLPISNITTYLSQVKDVPDGETLNWFKSQGATYVEY